LDFFVSKLPTGLNIFEGGGSNPVLREFSQFALALPPGDEIRDLILRERIVPDALAFLSEHSTVDDPVLPVLLDTLAGMARGHTPTQTLLAADQGRLLALLLNLENLPSAFSSGEHAGLVLAALEESPSVCKAVVSELRSKRAELARARADAERARAMEAAQAPLPQTFLDLMDGLTEQTWECCICKEGYEYFPDRVLGVYAFANRVGLAINTATYFVCIHPSCHEQAPISGRQSEWEAASVRNCERPCNCIFPLPSQSLPTGKYRAAVLAFWGRVGASSDPFTAAVADVWAHVTRLAERGRIPVSAGGGSLASIMSLIPFLVYAGHVVRQGAITPGANAEEEAVRTLWSVGLREWQTMRAGVLAKIVKEKGATEWAKVKQAFVFFIIVDRMQGLLKRECDDWVAEFMNRAESDGPGLAAEFSEFADFAEETIFVLENLESAWALADVGEGNPEEFVRESLK
jgi:E3 ubiquitin-protein ligase UBR4